MTAAPEPHRPDSGLLATPQPRHRHYTVISVDDHLHEPRNVFEGRMSRDLAALAPAVIERPDGSEVWTYEDATMFENGFCNVAGRDVEAWTPDPVRYDEVRRGSWDINHRVTDMDIDGVYAQICFPSGVFGFGGRIFPLSKDRKLGLACMRAYNQWHLEELAGTHPGRVIPMQCVWFTDPVVAAQEIRRNAALGFRAATLPDLPQHLGLPRITEAYWNPIMEALEETETVVCLHLGAATWVLNPRPNHTLNSDPGAVRDMTASALFPASSMVTGIEWTFSGVPARYPDLKIALSEGGIGWVPMAVDRIDYMGRHSGAMMREVWKSEETPREVLLNHFWFCMIDNPSTLGAVDMIGSDHIMVETDYPHSDSTWPNSQELLHERFQNMPTDDVLNMTYRTAEKLFRHPVPQSWLATTDLHS